jgi:hypothetical protein
LSENRRAGSTRIRVTPHEIASFPDGLLDATPWRMRFLVICLILAGCCPSNSATMAQPNSYVETDLGAIDDAGCATLCTKFLEPRYRVTGPITSCSASVVDAGVAQVNCTFPVSTCVD